MVGSPAVNSLTNVVCVVLLSWGFWFSHTQQGKQNCIYQLIYWHWSTSNPDICVQWRWAKGPMRVPLYADIFPTSDSYCTYGWQTGSKTNTPFPSLHIKGQTTHQQGLYAHTPMCIGSPDLESITAIRSEEAHARLCMWRLALRILTEEFVKTPLRVLV